MIDYKAIRRELEKALASQHSSQKFPFSNRLLDKAPHSLKFFGKFLLVALYHPNKRGDANLIIQEVSPVVRQQNKCWEHLETPMVLMKYGKAN